MAVILDGAGNVSINGSLAPPDTVPVVTGSADLTKKVRIEADGLTTNTTRVITIPDADVTLAAGTAASTSNKLSAFAATSSSELAGVISDETGSGLLVFGTSPTVTTPSLIGATTPSVALTDGATVATNAALSNYFRLTTTQNFTLSNPTNPSDGQRVVWEIIQDGTGSRVMTLGNAFALGTDITAATLTTTASKRDFITAVYNSTAAKWYLIGFVKGY